MQQTKSLLQAKRTAAAVRGVTDWLEQHRPAQAEQLEQFACLLVSFGESETSARLLREAIEMPDLPPMFAANCWRHYADCQNQLPRWKALVEAIDRHPSPANSTERAELRSQLLEEVRLEICGR